MGQAFFFGELLPLLIQLFKLMHGKKRGSHGGASVNGCQANARPQAACIQECNQEDKMCLKGFANVGARAASSAEAFIENMNIWVKWCISLGHTPAIGVLPKAGGGLASISRAVGKGEVARLVSWRG